MLRLLQRASDYEGNGLHHRIRSFSVWRHSTEDKMHVAIQTISILTRTGQGYQAGRLNLIRSGASSTEKRHLKQTSQPSIR